MIIAVSSTDGDHKSEFNPRFGRASFFVLYDTDSNIWKKVQNPARNARGGSGVQVVQVLAEQDVGVVISGRYGPNAITAIQQAGMLAYRGDEGTPAELVAKYGKRTLEQVTSSPSRGFHGKGL
jgi:predicted Fe-Mo cluster-binding NifX family protein